MKSSYFRKAEAIYLPKTMIKDFRLEALDEQGQWQTIQDVKGNYQRRVILPLNLRTKAIRLVPLATWGAEDCHIFSFDIS